MRTFRRPRAAVVAVVALLAALTVGCGNQAGGAGTARTTSSTTADAATGDWLLRFVTAEGADGEQSRAVYVLYNPTTGEATAHALRRVTASDVSQDEQVLLVSADHTRAILDTGVPKAERDTGKLTIYSVTTDATETLDIRAVTGRHDLRAVAWAFDPTAADVIRVVDSDHAVWKVDLASRTATKEGQLPHRSGWIFANGFDKATGEPYIESIDSDRTEPAGNGSNDTRPVQRQGGSLFSFEGDDIPGLPKPPCGFAGGFEFDDGTAWLFCADTPSISAYQAHRDGTSWLPFGTPSAKIVPAVAAELSFVLPPVS